MLQAAQDAGVSRGLGRTPRPRPWPGVGPRGRCFFGAAPVEPCPSGLTLAFPGGWPRPNAEPRDTHFLGDYRWETEVRKSDVPPSVATQSGAGITFRAVFFSHWTGRPPIRVDTTTSKVITMAAMVTTRRTFSDVISRDVLEICKGRTHAHLPMGTLRPTCLPALAGCLLLLRARPAHRRLGGAVSGQLGGDRAPAHPVVWARGSSATLPAVL